MTVELVLPYAEQNRKCKKYVKKEAAEIYNEFWNAAVDVIDSSIHSKTPTNKTLEELEEDEAFDMQIIPFILDKIIPHSLNIPALILDRLVNGICKGTLLPAEISLLKHSPSNESAVCFVKEKFIFGCMELLFGICSEQFASSKIAD